MRRIFFFSLFLLFMSSCVANKNDAVFSTSSPIKINGTATMKNGNMPEVDLAYSSSPISTNVPEYVDPRKDIPKGEYIAYLDLELNYIYLMNMDEEIFPFYPLKTEYASLSNNNGMMFVGGENGYYIVDFENGRTFSNRFIISVEYASWSLDDSKIVFSGIELQNDMKSIYLYDLSLAEVNSLTSSDTVIENPEWSPDNENIVFASDHFNVIESPPNVGYTELFVMNANDLYLGKDFISNVTQITFSDIKSTYPSWSPDGNIIAYICINRGSKSLVQDVCILDLRESALRVLTDEIGGHNYKADWSSTGELLAFTHINEIHDVFVYNFNTGELRNFTNNPDSYEQFLFWITIE